jgi:uncharacterized membrane protein
MYNRRMKAFTKYFLRGLLVIAPTAITVYVVWRVVATIDQALGVSIPGLGLVLAGGLIALVGFLVSNVVGQSVVARADAIFAQLPLVKLLYTSIRDLVGAFVGKKKMFDRPVAIVLPGGIGRLLGFVTRESLDFGTFEGHVAVYVPQSYNFAGTLILVDRSRIEPLDVTSTELMTFIVSAGVAAGGPRGEMPMSR